MSAVVVLRDELEIDGAHGPLMVLDFEAYVGEDEMIALDVKTVSLGHGEPCVPVGLTV
jgi:hypothetical protein